MPMDGLTDSHYPDTWKFSLGDLAAPELWLLAGPGLLGFTARRKKLEAT